MASPNGIQHLRFGEFEVWPATGELRKNGVLLRLQPQPFRLFSLLLTRPGELVTREEIQRELWGADTTVEFDQGLNYCIRQIRAVLGDDARDPRFIETVPKRGYRFIASLSEIPLQEGPTEPSPKQDLIEPVAANTQVGAAGAVVASLPQQAHYFTGLSQAVVLTMLAVLAAGGLWTLVLGKSADRNGPKSILVRPFVSIGLSQQDDWFADALTQQLISEIARTKMIHVIPWTTALGLKNQPLSTPELRNRFGVDTVLEGSVTRVGERLKIGTHLIDAKADRTVWSHEDQRDLLDLGGLQDDLTGSLAEVLKLRLTEGEGSIARRRPEDPEVYNLYLRAVYLADQYTDETTAKSIEYFSEVIRQAPTFARAYAGLALAQSIQPPSPATRVEALLDAQTAARKAIELDPTLAEGHAALAHSLFKVWQWKAAEKEFQIALGLDPELATTHQLYGIYLATLGRSEEAVREARRAVELAPSSALITYSFATVLFHAGRFEDAIVQCRRAQELSPHYVLAYLTLTRALTSLGRTKEAFAILEEWERFSPDNVQPCGSRQHSPRQADSTLPRKL
jgi:TolB-like protein/DNA-binding winged helix-turn-helix (wHTH) protein